MATAAHVDRDRARGRRPGRLVLSAALVADDDSAGADRGATLDVIIEDPRAFAGEEVTVSGEVADAARVPDVLSIGEDGRVIVLPRRDASMPSRVSQGDVVRVQGRVELMTRDLADGADFAFDTDAVFGPGAFDAWTEDVAIVASRIVATTARDGDGVS